MQQIVLHFHEAKTHHLEQLAIEMPSLLAICRPQLVRLCPDYADGASAALPAADFKVIPR